MSWWQLSVIMASTAARGITRQTCSSWMGSGFASMMAVSLLLISRLCCQIDHIYFFIRE